MRCGSATSAREKFVGDAQLGADGSPPRSVLCGGDRDEADLVCGLRMLPVDALRCGFVKAVSGA